MDILTLKRYHRQSSVADKNINSLQKLQKSKKLPAGNTSLTNKGLVRFEREFLEFFINDQPLSEMLDKFYPGKEHLLDNWIGILGSFENHRAEIMRVKQLLKKNISDVEIRKAYPAEWSDSEFQWYLEKEREILLDPDVIIYCCAECGDYDCGGIRVKIDKSDDAFIWTFTEGGKRLTFAFDKYQYFELFDKYIRQLEKKG